MKKITTKTIEDQNPHLVLSVIAETVAEKAVSHALSDRFEQWENLSKSQKETLNDDYKTELHGLVSYLCERANTHYQYNKDFNHKVKAKSNTGRDYLYMFMYHWSGGHDDGSGNIRFKTPGDYKKSFVNWKRDKAAFEAAGE